MLSIAVLGPLEVRRNGALVPVPAGKSAELLVRLALDAGTAVRTDRLVDDLWVDDAVRTQRNTLQSKVTRLRRALGDPAAIVTTDDGYLLAVDRTDVDALSVLDHTSIAVGLLGTGDERGALEVARSALDLFRGDGLTGAGEWADPHRARLDEARLALIETRATARLRMGELGEVIGELEAAVAAHPFQEQLWVLLITALYRSGRQADALAAHQRIRATLADELGLEPGQQLRDLEQRILVHDPSLSVQPSASGRTDGAAATSGNLPTMAADLVGRDAEMTHVRSLLATERLVAIVGPGGVGKTALAVAVASTVPASKGPASAVWLVRLESASTDEDVIDTVIAALQVTGGEAALFERVRNSDALIVLDNCEHVVDAVARLVGRLLDVAPGLRLLCTSQVPLDVLGEQVFELPPLAIDDAVELFNRRATAQRRNRQLDDAGGSVHELCRSLDGLPLAIELAAARTRTLSVGEITRRLDDRFHVLHDPTSRQPERRRALKATIRWSYEMLFPDDQRGLWALATFAGGAPLEAVEFVLGALDVPAPAAIDVVDRLASRSLVIVDDESSPAHPRYRLLDSIRAYALDAMAEAGWATAAYAAHTQWFADAAARSMDGVRTDRQGEHLTFARVERANIDVGLAWCAGNDALQGVAIANGFGRAWVVLGDSRGAQRILAALDAAGSSAPLADRATSLLLAGWIEASTGDLDQARTHIALATRLADEIGDAELHSRCCDHLAYVVSHHGRFAEAIVLADESRRLLSGLDRPWEQAASWLLSARASISSGDRPAAADACAAVQHWLTRVDDPWLHSRAEGMLGEFARIEHRFDDAVTHFEQAIATSRRLGFQQTEAYQVSCLGRALSQAGQPEAGRDTLQLAVDRAEAIGDVRMAALARVHLGRVLRGMGGEARPVLESAARWHREAGGGEQALLGECLLAALDAADEVDGAAERLTDLLASARSTDSAHVEVFALDALARVAAREGRIDDARSLCAAADERMQVAAHFITDLDRVDARVVRLLTVN